MSAFVVSGGFLSLVVWFVWNDATAKERGKAQESIRAQAAPKVTGRETAVEPVVSDATDVRIDVMDRDEPTRQAGIIRFARMEPLEARHVAVTGPQASMFLKDGRTIVVTGESGRLYMPGGTQKEPESGRISGGVTIRLFEARPDGSRIDPDRDTPSLTFTTRSLAFDSALGEATTPDPFEVRLDDADAKGTGLRLVFNQLTQRLERGEIKAGGTITFRPKAEGSREPVSAARAPAATGPTPGRAPASQPRRALESLYRIVLSESVVAGGGPRRVTADSLTIWARLVDQKLPPGALAPVRIASGPGRAKPRADAGGGRTALDESLAFVEPTVSLGAAGTATTAAIVSPAGAGTSAEQPVTLSWAGPCTIVPLEAAPAELRGQDLSLRFTAEKSGLVLLEDTEGAGRGHAASLEYGASTRRLTLAGLGPASAMLEAQGQGRIEAVRIEADLATGVVKVPGPSVLSAPRGGELFDISSSEQADFAFRMDNGELTRELEHAIFRGSVRAKDPTGTAMGGLARAEFVADEAGRSGLRRLVMEEDARIESASSGSLQAKERVEVTFRPGPDGSPDPATVVALGAVKGEREGMSVAAESLEAHLARSPAGRVDLRRAELRGDAEFTSVPDMIRASGATIVADLGWDSEAVADEHGRFERRQRVTLLGTGSTVARHDPRSGERTTIVGEQIDADGVARTLRSFGEGRFEHSYPSKMSGQTSTVRATWGRAMEFDDLAGTLLCEGGARAEAEADAMSLDRLEAERVRLEIAPAGSEAGASSGTGLATNTSRKLIRAEAIGAVEEREGGGPAWAESRRYAENPGGGRTLQQLRFVEGPRLLLEDEGKRLDVPGAGRLLLADRTAERAEAPGARGATHGAPSTLASSASSRGEALFEWAGSMRLSERAGTIEMRDRVSLVHQRLLDGLVTTATGERMTATMHTAGAEGRGDLASAVAEGAVYVSSGPARTAAEQSPRVRELRADRVDYDATRGILEAIATAPALVTIVDPVLGTPTTAESLVWDLVKDAVTIRKPGTVVVPR